MKPQKYKLDGERYSLSQLAWSTGISETVLRHRIHKLGFSVKEAVEIPVNYRKKIAAFGELKPVSLWAKDPRCKVSRQTLTYRIFVIGWEAEKAITTPVDLSKASHVTAFGETKSLTEWTRDPRARKGTTITSITRRIRRGMSPEDAISKPPQETTLFTAFGETKSLRQWVDDPRCVIGSTALRKRLETGIPFETALTNPPSQKSRVITAFGEQKKISDWVEDPRCVIVDARKIVARISQGWHPEKALTTFREYYSRPLPAFGEEKSAEEWARDPRCKVSSRTLNSRIQKGWDVERAIAEPSRIKKKRGIGKIQVAPAEEFGYSSPCVGSVLRTREIDDTPPRETGVNESSSVWGGDSHASEDVA